MYLQTKKNYSDIVLEKYNQAENSVESEQIERSSV